MIELYRDHSGEVDISTGPGSEGKPSVLANISTTQDDANKIAELRGTIESLKSQIRVCLYTYMYQGYIIFPKFGGYIVGGGST